jgi:hypothetical protein
MKDFEEYRKNNTSVDRVLRDMMIEINKLKYNLKFLYVIVILAIFATVAHNVLAEPEEYQEFLEGVDGVTNVTFGNDTSHLYDKDTKKDEREK